MCYHIIVIWYIITAGLVPVNKSNSCKQREMVFRAISCTSAKSHHGLAKMRQLVGHSTQAYGHSCFMLFTARAYARAVLGVVILSVCPSVTLVHWDKTKWRTADIFIPHERAITLLLRYQEWLVGNAPFPMKSTFKVTHPFEKRRLRPISAHNVSTVVQLRWI